MMPHEGLICYTQPIPSIIYPPVMHPPKRVECSVDATIGADGIPYGIVATCDDPRFEQSAADGIATLHYPVEDKSSARCPHIGRTISYPLEFATEY